MMYQDGIGVTQDYAEAIRLYRLAAAQNDGVALLHLGNMFALGLGGARNDAEAVKWYRLSAARGNMQAQTYLAAMYSDGVGVGQDYVRAHMWFNILSAEGKNTGTEYRDKMAARMTPEQIADAPRMARECQERNLQSCN
jgi:uncharacterized protein